MSLEVGVPPDMVVLALPCPVSQQAIPLEEVFIGIKGWGTLAADLFAKSNHKPGKVWVLNNGELAAWAAARQKIQSEWASVLVLSLGFGVSICGLWKGYIAQKSNIFPPSESSSMLS